VATSQADIVSQLKAALAASLPELDTSVGTPMGKILDAFAGTLSDAYLDNHLLTYTYDIDSKNDADLDAFTQLFGIARLPAKRATGTVTFTRGSDNTDSIVFIPINFQIASATDTGVIFQTVTGATMNVGTLSVTVPIQAVEAGPEGNVGPNTIINMSSPIQGVASVTNTSATSGGMDQETDSALRARWKATVFRNLAGTEDMFLGIALNDPDCFSANVVTATKSIREQIQIQSGSATSTVSDAKYVFGTPVFLGQDIDNGNVYVNGHDYTFTPTLPPTITVNSSTAIPDGTICDLEYQYTPVASRSDPANGILNRVDVWCAGTRAVAAQQSLVFRNTKTFSTSGAYNLNNFIRPDGTKPVSGNVFIPLAYGPIVTVSPTVTINSTTYGLATASKPMGTVSGGVTYAYQIVHDNTANGWTPQSQFGLEWHAGALPPNNSVFTLGVDGAYTYNEVPTSVQTELDSWRLAGTDVRAHQATAVLLQFSFAIMYERISYPPQVNQAINAALSDWLNSLGISAFVQVSDVLQVVHNVPGVDNVRFLNGADYPTWTFATTNNFAVGIQRLTSAGTVQSSLVDTTGRPKDWNFTDSEVPQFGGCVFVQKAANSFGSY
jgi:uncharacterized phage protein gp47/JayE